ncbi:hypothetical protein L3N51_01928 [Metallosphaera sp. J1]|uniref:winged helix-turn-helix domain-containing protein n=1 Tax=Metallosphaera javensis (ex Hofmann et al. 2022) TaxID=99938 RepID=UPI001EDF679F|nr:winged helix-turn-helix domain-containing protein [Metallosphaera javensis (ex Hofmann et al. 2022)]MCG3109633.1 hypothetical protein [Metallosphaera javensis (ex Hofmann et al. 2022)]
MLLPRKKRTKYDIEYDILTACKNGIRKTALMYKANLSYELANKYISKLKGQGYISFDGILYHTTENGLKRLEDLEKFRKAREEFQQLSESLRKSSYEMPEEDTTKKGGKFFGRDRKKEGSHNIHQG